MTTCTQAVAPCTYVSRLLRAGAGGAGRRAPLEQRLRPRGVLPVRARRGGAADGMKQGTAGC